jgi:hypothetical protein
VTPGQLAVRVAPGGDAIFVRLRGEATAGPPTSARSIFVSVAGTTTAAATAIVQPFVGRDRAADAQDVDGPAGDRGSIFAIRRSAGGAP